MPTSYSRLSEKTLPRRVVRVAFAALVGAAGVGVVVAAIWRGRAPPLEIFVPHADHLDQYVGAARCNKCHREICDQQPHSRMARALSAAEELCQQRQLPLPGEVYDRENNLHYRVASQPAGLVLEVSRGQEVASAAIHYALGSGDRGLTFVCDSDADTYQELRISYYADTGSWDLTPGQDVDHPATLEEALGRRIAKRSDLACLNCHSSWLVQSGGKIDLTASHFGIDCERCHGPGRAHAEAAAHGMSVAIRSPSFVQAAHLAEALREGRQPDSPQDEFLLSVALAGDDRLLRDLYVCGECHGRRQIWSLPDEEQLPRFQVAALVASKCYRESATKLRCTDCHDPHRDIEPADRLRSVAVCLACHVASEANAPADESSVASASGGTKICPINRVSNCISCHMPPRSPMYRTRFTHHRIGVYPE